MAPQDQASESSQPPLGVTTAHELYQQSWGTPEIFFPDPICDMEALKLIGVPQGTWSCLSIQLGFLP